MSRSSRYADNVRLDGLYRDKENGWLFGVCAGLAERFDFRTGPVRLVAVISLVLFFWPTVLAYLAAALLLREKPLIYAGRCREYEFWRCSSRHDHWSHP